MAISIELILKSMGLIQSAKQSSEAVGEIAESLDEVGEAGTDATSVAKAALEDLRRANMDHVRVMNQTFGEMTEAEQEEFRKRFDNADALQKAITDLDRRRAEAAKSVNQDYTAEYERTFGKLEDTAEDASRKVADSTEKGFERAGDAAKDAGQTITDELGGALGELDDTAQGAADGALGALRGLSALIPGVGAAIGAGLATIGSLFVRDFFDSAKETESRVDRLYEYLLESEANYLTASQMQKAAAEAMDDDTMVQRAKAIAAAFEIPFVEAMAIIVENGATARDMLAEVEERFASSAGGARGIGTDITTEWVAARDALTETVGEFDTALGRAQDLRGVIAFLPGGLHETTAAANDAGLALDRVANPRSTSIGVEVDLEEAERKVAEWQRRQRTIRVGIGVASGERVIQ